MKKQAMHPVDAKQNNGVREWAVLALLLSLIVIIGLIVLQPSPALAERLGVDVIVRPNGTVRPDPYTYTKATGPDDLLTSPQSTEPATLAADEMLSTTPPVEVSAAVLPTDSPTPEPTQESDATSDQATPAESATPTESATPKSKPSPSAATKTPKKTESPTPKPTTKPTPTPKVTTEPTKEPTAEPLPSTAPPQISMPSGERNIEMLSRVNQLRAAAGANPLSWSNDLSTSASVRAQEVVLSFDHYRPDGRRFDSAITEGRYLMMGENIARGQTSVNQVMNEWTLSADHYAAIIKPEFTEMGLGVVSVDGTMYWVQLFGAR